MKRLFFTIALCFTGFFMMAQVPQSFQYQAVARNANGQLIANQNISIRISIQDAPGSSVSAFYVEDHNDVQTNEYGLFSLKIGEGLQDGSNAFDGISWGVGTWYIKVEVDQDGGTDDNFAKIGDPVPLSAVPYALFALESADSPSLGLDDLTDVSASAPSNNQVLKYNGTNWVPSTDATADADSDPNNENQTLSLNGDDLSISNGNTVTLPLVPSGTMMMFCGPAANVPAGWLVCDGGQYTQTQYPDLFAAIGTAWGGSGSSFNVPDMRGRFARGQDDGQGRDRDAATRTASNTGGNTGDAVGSVQEDAFQGHRHELRVASTANGTNNNHVAWATNAVFYGGGAIQEPIELTYPGGTYEVPRIAAETRPQNVYVLYIIKT